MRTRPYWITLFVAIVSFGIGGWTGFFYGTREQAQAGATARAMLAGKALVAEADSLESAYATKNLDVERAQLEHYIAALTQLAPALPPLLTEDNITTDLGIAYARLALVYGELGDGKKKEHYAELATQTYPKTDGRAVTKDELYEMARRLGVNSRGPKL